MFTRTGLLLTAGIAFAVFIYIGINSNTKTASLPTIDSTNKLSNLEVFSCSQAQTVLYSKGYRNIEVVDCNGSQYRFSALRKNKRNIITLNAFSGGMVALLNSSRSFASNNPKQFSNIK